MAAVDKQSNSNTPSSPEDVFTEKFKPIARLSHEKFKSFEWKDGDITVLAVPRSGTHFVWMLTRMLLQGSADPIAEPMEESHVWLPSFKDTQTSPRVLNSHFSPTDVEERVIKGGNRKIIYVSRNCKDVSVSQFNFFKAYEIYTKEAVPDVWADYLPTFYDSGPVFHPSESESAEKKPLLKPPSETPASSCGWVVHNRAWEDYAAKNPDAPILFLRFEDIVRKPEEIIRKMAKFLSVTVSDERLRSIVAASKFGQMKHAPVTKELQHMWKQGIEKTFYRKGAIGDWKNWYTVAQNEYADQLLAKQMAGSKITQIYE